MVTAGVYLCCRMYTVFEMAPEVMMFISITGAVTLLWLVLLHWFKPTSNVFLAYSTMSQLGYMFMAVGAGRRIKQAYSICFDSRILQSVIVLVFRCSDFGMSSRTKHFFKWVDLFYRFHLYSGFRHWWRCIIAISNRNSWLLLERCDLRVQLCKSTINSTINTLYGWV